MRHRTSGRRMMRLRSPLFLLCLAGVLLLLSSPLRDGDSTGSRRSDGGLMGCAAATKVADSCCDRETIDIGNDEIMHDRLQKLRTYTFFRIFRVDLHSECPFWRDNPQCARRNCAVCDQCDEIPTSPFAHPADHSASSSSGSSSSMMDGNVDSSGFGSMYGSSSVDRTMLNGFTGWSDTDECQWIAPESSAQGRAVYINLQLNPEGYTGYEGEEAHRIWRAIYEQNCFNARINAVEEGELNQQTAAGTTGGMVALPPAQDFASSSGGDASGGGLMRPANVGANGNALLANTVAAVDFANLCLEQRVFYRLVSGLHASISCHISNAFPVGSDVDPYIDLHAPEHCALIGPNVDEWYRRVGAHPDRLNNLYFAFVFLLRAVNKASDALRTFNYSTGVPGREHEAAELSALVEDTLLSSPLVKSCVSSASFDEASMFASERGPYLKKQLRAAFRNISRIMDCVGCEKCKLHGKLQILGMGTALRLMFSDPTSTKPVKLVRNEVMALIVTLSKFSHALHITRDMQARMDALALGIAPPAVSSVSSSAAATVGADATTAKQTTDSTGEAIVLPALVPPRALGPLLLALLLVVLTSTALLVRWLWARRGPGGTVARRGSLSSRHGRRNGQRLVVEGNGHAAAAAAATSAHAASLLLAQKQADHHKSSPSLDAGAATR